MNNIDIKSVWMQTANLLSPEAEKEWKTIAEKYNNKKRHYHTLQHLTEVYSLLHEYYQGSIPSTTILSLFYHDFEYNTLRGDNEIRSAVCAKNRLEQWNVQDEAIHKIYSMIVSTQTHQTKLEDEEVKIFLDADMAILGADEDTYSDYLQKVRREFSIYPDLLYNRGRKQFLKKTLKAQSIFLTEYFRNKFEKQARINLQNEINQL